MDKEKTKEVGEGGMASKEEEVGEERRREKESDKEQREGGRELNHQ